MSIWLKKIDTILLGTLALVAIGVSVFDFAHLSSVETLNPAVPSLITLVFLALIAIHLIVSRTIDEGHQDLSSKLLNQISEGVSLGEFRVFPDSAEMEHYLAKRVLEAKKSVCDLSWKTRISEGFAAGHRQISHGNLDHCISEASARVSYREIFVFSDSRRVEKMERRLAENRSGYSCSYYKDDSKIPRLQFVIIDDEEVLFFAASAHSQLCTTRSPELCRVFKPYFDEAWHNATPIKDGPNVHAKEVEKIRRMFS